MATINPFDLLDDDAEDPSLIAALKPVVSTPAAAAAKKGPAQAQLKPAPPAKLPSKPLPPSQAVREAKTEGGRGGRAGGAGRGYGRGRGGYNRDFNNNESPYGSSGAPVAQGAGEDGDTAKTFESRGYGGPRGGFRGGRRGGFGNEEGGEGERPRRTYERWSGTGRGNEMKREGSGRGNWGTSADELAQITEEAANEGEKNFGNEKPVEESAADRNKENTDNEPELKEAEDKVMTLEEYEKVLEEKRKALQTLMTEERKVDAKEFQFMQQLSNKKENNDVFIKLGSDKDKRKEANEKAKKSVSINEFLKPAEGERYYDQGSRSRGRGRGRGARGFGNRDGMSNVPAPSIEDPGQFPTLGGK